MTTPLARHYMDVASRLKDLLDANKLSLGIDSVYYGDQTLIPTGVAVCVEPAPSSRQLQGSSNMTLNALTAFILVYVSRVDLSQSDRRLLADKVSKDIEYTLHTNLQLRDSTGNNPIVIHGYISELDPGYAVRNKGMLLEAVRMKWVGTTKTMLSQQP